MEKETLDNLIVEHRKEKQESEQFKKRRFNDWNENYTLYRDKVRLNRLTQRQAINVPIMRESIQTWISKIDEAPELMFETRGNSIKDKSGELILNELWNYYYDKLDLDIVDNVDKKVVGLQGRSFKLAGFKNNEFFLDLLDPYDVEISPRVNPLDLNTAQYVIRTGIFVPLKEIVNNQKYDSSARAKLKIYFSTKEGQIKANDTREAYLAKQQRLQELGSQSIDLYAGSDTVVELNHSFKNIWNEKEKRYVRHFIVIAADWCVLYKKPIKEALGINRIPIVSWASDPDMNDVWSDGLGDAVRTFNKVTNMYISQDLENRTFRNFGMYFYNTMNGTFQPKAFDPKPFGMYGVPGNPAEILQQVRIEPLNDTANQITFLKDLIQNSVAQTPTERGLTAGSRTTLGEVQLSLQQSQTRNQVVAKQYRNAWKEIGQLFYELMDSNARGQLKLYKKGESGKYYSKEVFPSDWKNKEGYECRVMMKAEKESQDQFSLQKQQYVIQNFMNNPAAVKIAKRKQLELLDYSTEEIDQIMQNEGVQQPMPEMEQETQPMEQPMSNEAIMKQT